MKVNQFVSKFNLQDVAREALQPEFQITLFGNERCRKEWLILPRIVFGLLAGIPHANFPVAFDSILQFGPLQNMLDDSR
jgi:hypothetical protein